jgi:exosortase
MNSPECFKSGSRKANSAFVRAIVFLVILSVVILLWPALKAALAMAYGDDRYIQILAAPILCAFLIWWDRQSIFSVAPNSSRLGIPLFAISSVFCLVAASIHFPDSSAAKLAVPTLSLVLLLHAGFLLCYGVGSWRRAIYPLSCLLMLIPIPGAAMDWLISAFQQGSAVSSGAVLDLIGVSALRQGTTFSIPGLEFNIAPECSGIRSGVAFLLVGILASRLYLRSPFSRTILILSTIPITIFKNSIRIVVTTTLGAYVDRSFIDGPFHHQYGGIIFSPLDFLLFVPLLLSLQKLEGRSANRQPALATSPIA